MNDVRACQPRQIGPSCRDFLTSWARVPKKARNSTPPATRRLRGLVEIERWASAQSMKLQLPGWRVIANTPVGSRVIGLGSAPGRGKAGLRTSEPTSRMLANRVIADAIGHHQSGATQPASGTVSPHA